jgi:hypothetical protein
MTALVDTASLAAFDAYAEARGGRSALLRQMIEQALKDNGAAPVFDRADTKRASAYRCASQGPRTR